MALSQSNKITVEDRNALYFNKYKYRVAFEVVGAGKTRYVRNIYDFDVRIKESRDNLRRYPDSQELTRLNNIQRDEIESLLELRDQFTGKDIGVYSPHYSDKVKIYTNDPVVIDKIKFLGFKSLKITEANACVPSGFMYFKREPKFKYRVYLKSRTVDQAFKDNMKSFFKTYTDIVATPALAQWLNNGTRFWWSKSTQPSHFIEFNDEKHYMIVLMMYSDIVSKHFELQKAK